MLEIRNEQEFKGLLASKGMLPRGAKKLLQDRRADMASAFAEGKMALVFFTTEEIDDYVLPCEIKAELKKIIREEQKAGYRLPGAVLHWGGMEQYQKEKADRQAARALLGCAPGMGYDSHGNFRGGSSGGGGSRNFHC